MSPLSSPRSIPSTGTYHIQLNLLFHIQTQQCLFRINLSGIRFSPSSSLSGYISSICSTGVALLNGPCIVSVPRDRNWLCCVRNIIADVYSDCEIGIYVHQHIQCTISNRYTAHIKQDMYISGTFVPVASWALQRATFHPRNSTSK